MTTNKRKKRHRTIRENKQEEAKRCKPSGWFVAGVWVVTILLVSVTVSSYQDQMKLNGYAHLSLHWLLIFLVLELMAIGVTVLWLGSRRNKSRKNQSK